MIKAGASPAATVWSPVAYWILVAATCQRCYLLVVAFSILDSDF